MKRSSPSLGNRTEQPFSDPRLIRDVQHRTGSCSHCSPQQVCSAGPDTCTQCWHLGPWWDGENLLHRACCIARVSLHPSRTSPSRTSLHGVAAGNLIEGGVKLGPGTGSTSIKSGAGPGPVSTSTRSEVDAEPDACAEGAGVEFVRRVFFLDLD